MGSLTNSEVERTEKKEAVPEFEVLSRHLPGSREKSSDSRSSGQGSYPGPPEQEACIAFHVS